MSEVYTRQTGPQKWGQLRSPSTRELQSYEIFVEAGVVHIWWLVMLLDLTLPGARESVDYRNIRGMLPRIVFGAEPSVVP